MGRKIINFVDDMTTILQKAEGLQEFRVNAIRSAIVKGVREAEKKQKISKYLLNDVKLSALRTLVNWTDNPERMMTKISDKQKTRVKKQRGRKKEKGKYVAPRVELAREWELVGDDSIRLMLIVANDFIHPYQNIELELEFSSDLIVTKVSPYSWAPEQKSLRIGFLEADLGIEPSETQILLELQMRERREEFQIRGKLHYDNCNRGIQDVVELETRTIRLI